MNRSRSNSEASPTVLHNSSSKWEYYVGVPYTAQVPSLKKKMLGISGSKYSMRYKYTYGVKALILGQCGLSDYLIQNFIERLR